MGASCSKRLSSVSLFGKQVAGDLNGGRITSDAGGLLLREFDELCGLDEGAAK
jgi:hypothetical protein